MDKVNIRLRELFDLHLSQSATELEREEFWDYVNDPVYSIQIQQMVSDTYEMKHDQSGLDELQRQTVLKNIFKQDKATTHSEQDKGVVLLWPRIAVAAAIMLVLFGAGFFYFANYTQTGVVKTAYQNDIKPGGNKAYLSLANGERIVLTDRKNGEVATQAGITITKTADGQLEYKVAESKSASAAMNTIETPKGGQYTVVLPDGSKIYLNSASVLKYPVSFTGLPARKVQLTGEGYFEISKDKEHPFIVQSKGQEVEVLGTHFNVKAYNDEAYVKTTLLEGSVKVWGEQIASRIYGDNVVLKPGQQSVLANDTKISVQEVNIEDAVAWKNGYFMFNNVSLEGVMREISRWYNVDIDFKDRELGRKEVYATITRFTNVSRVLELLEQTGVVSFEIKGRQISVLKRTK